MREWRWQRQAPANCSKALSDIFGSCGSHRACGDRKLEHVRDGPPVRHPRRAVELGLTHQEKGGERRRVGARRPDAREEVDPVRVVEILVEREVHGADGQAIDPPAAPRGRRLEADLPAGTIARKTRDGRCDPRAVTGTRQAMNVCHRAGAGHRHDLGREAAVPRRAAHLRVRGRRQEGRFDERQRLCESYDRGAARLVAGRDIPVSRTWRLDRQPSREGAQLLQLALQRLALRPGTEERRGSRGECDEKRGAENGEEPGTVQPEYERCFGPERARHARTVAACLRCARLCSPPMDARLRTATDAIGCGDLSIEAIHSSTS